MNTNKFKIIFLFALLGLCGNSFCQSLSKGQVAELKEKSYEQLKHDLMTFRTASCHSIALGWFPEFKCPVDSIPYYKEKYYSYFPDYSVNSLVDGAIVNRILQLLRNEYYDGEYEMAIKFVLSDEADKIVKSGIFHLRDADRKKILSDTSTTEYKEFRDSCLNSRYVYLLNTNKQSFLFDFKRIVELCSYVHNDSIISELKSIAGDDVYKQYSDNIIAALVNLKVPPYYSDFLKSKEYDDNQPISTMIGNINSLYYDCYDNEGIREMSEYILTEKKEEIDPSVYDDIGNIYYYPVRFYVYEHLLDCIVNQSFWDLLGTKNPNTRGGDVFIFGNKYLEHIDSKRIEIYNWLKLNYGNYQLLRRW